VRAERRRARRDRNRERPLDEDATAPAITGDAIAERFAVFYARAYGWHDLRDLCQVAKLPYEWLDITEAVVGWRSLPADVAAQSEGTGREYTEAEIKNIVRHTVAGLWRAAHGDPYHKLLVFAILREVFDSVTLRIAGYDNGA